MSEQDEARKFARDDLARVIYQHKLKQGESTPYMRDCEKLAHERADVVDKKRDWKEDK